MDEGARAPARVRRACGSARPSTSIRTTARCRFGFERRPCAAEDLVATLERLLELPGELGAERGRRVALIFDEFQEIVDIDPALPRLMRAVFQEQPEVAHVYLGSSRHMMERLFSDENEPFWRSAKPIELGVIAPDAFGAVHRRRASSAPAAGSTRRSIDAVLAMTGGHPYATQELCYFALGGTPAGATAEPVDARRGAARCAALRERALHARSGSSASRAAATASSQALAMRARPRR